MMAVSWKAVWWFAVRAATSDWTSGGGISSNAADFGNGRRYMAQMALLCKLGSHFAGWASKYHPLTDLG